MLASVSFLASAVALACNQTHSSGNSNSSEQGGEGGVDAIGAGGMTHPINTHYNPPFSLTPPTPTLPFSVPLQRPHPLAGGPYLRHPHLLFPGTGRRQRHPPSLTPLATPPSTPPHDAPFNE